MFTILTVAIASQVYMCVKTYYIVLFKNMQFLKCQLCLSKTFKNVWSACQRRRRIIRQRQTLKSLGSTFHKEPWDSAWVYMLFQGRLNMHLDDKCADMGALYSDIRFNTLASSPGKGFHTPLAWHLEAWKKECPTVSRDCGRLWRKESRCSKQQACYNGFMI